MVIKNFNMEIAWPIHLIDKLKKDSIGADKNTHILYPTQISNIDEDKIMSPDDAGLSLKNPRWYNTQLRIYGQITKKTIYWLVGGEVFTPWPAKSKIAHTTITELPHPYNRISYVANGEYGETGGMGIAISEGIRKSKIARQVTRKN